MNIKELKAAIEDLPDDMRVILQSDSEGNGFRWASCGEPDGVVIEDSGWYAEIYSSVWSADEADMEPEEWAEYLAKPRVFVIAPVN